MRFPTHGRRWPSHAALFVGLILIGLLFVPISLANPGQTSEIDTPAQDTIAAAVAALGGPKFLGIKSQVSHGVFTPFIQGQRGFPTNFVDTVVYPDRNRTEFGKKKKERIIQANTWERGWKFDGPRETLEAQTPDEVQAYQRYVRANIDNILRGYWDDPGVLLRHKGKTEYAPRKWAEVVEMEYPDGFTVELLFDPDSHLPIASRYREGSESGASGSLVETRYYEPYLDFGGVKFPRTVDLYRDQQQTGRIVYERIDLNSQIDPSYFDQPANAKSIK